MADLSWVKVFSLGLSVWLLGCSPSPSNPSAALPDARLTPLAPSAITQTPAGQPQSLPISAQFEAADQVIQLEVASTPEQQATGLMFRTSLPDDRGMLFAFESVRPVSFWMRNTLIPLDMVFLLDGEVKAIASSVPPCTTSICPTYPSGAAVNQVIELRGGRAAELGLQIGQQLAIEAVDTQAPLSN